uniref:Uncharacterized protein n=1 Tax=Anopheles minimus TaxID=112268 RepID=A0A182W0X7_9DIPT
MELETLHAKQIHYPSGYPMPRSPPLFICSSPGPDPYRSHDNVYEELEHGPGRDTDSEPPIQSDDDFAEDELSLPGDRSFHKSPSDGGTTVATIYHDRSNGGSSNSAATTASGSTVPVTDGLVVGGTPGAYLERNRTERNSLLSSSSSSGNDNNHPLHHSGHRVGTTGGNGSSASSGANNNGGGSGGAAGGCGGVGSGGSNNNNGSNSSGSSSASNSNRNSNSSTDCGNNNSNNNNNNNHPGSVANGSNGTNCNGNSVVSSGPLGLFRTRKHHPATLGGGGSGRRTTGGGHPFATSVGNTCPGTLDGGPLGGDPVVLPPMYDDRGMMTLPPPAYNHTLSTSHHHHHPHHGHHSHHLNSVNNNSTTGGSGRSNYYSTIDDASELLDPVERRNRINAQLSASSGPIGTVSTIFRNGHRGPVAPGYGGVQPGGGRSRTNPRASDRRNGGGRNANGGSQLAVISTPQDPSQYIYHEPVFHEGLIYDGCLSHTYSDRSGGSGSTGTGSTGGVAYHPYLLPQFTTFRNGSVPGIVGGGGGPVGVVPPSSHPAGHSIYSRDSSFGSDSGYSQHTQTSNRSVAGWSQRRPTGQSTTSSNGPGGGNGGGGGSGLSAAVPPKAANAADQQPSSVPPTMVDS